MLLHCSFQGEDKWMDVKIPKVNERKGPYIKEEMNGYFPCPISNLQNPIQLSSEELSIN